MGWNLGPRLTRQGYNAKVLAEFLNAKPREIKSFLSGQLASGRRNYRVNCWRRESRFNPFSLMWSSPDVIGLFSNNVVTFSRNVVLKDPYSHLIRFQNRGCCRFEPIMFSVRYI